MDSTRSRRSKLVSRYFFECDCPRCQSESSAAVKGGGDPPSFFSLRCQWDGCSGRPVRVGPGENEEELGEGAKGCGVCGRRPDRRVRRRSPSHLHKFCTCPFPCRPSPAMCRPATWPAPSWTVEVPWTQSGASPNSRGCSTRTTSSTRGWPGGRSTIGKEIFPKRRKLLKLCE